MKPMVDIETWRAYLPTMPKQLRTKQSAVRFEPDIRERLDVLMYAMSTPARPATQSDVLRTVVYAGLPTVEASLGVKPPADMSDPMGAPRMEHIERVGHRGSKRRKGAGK